MSHYRSQLPAPRKDKSNSFSHYFLNFSKITTAISSNFNAFAKADSVLASKSLRKEWKLG